jgi:hypothetical protein
MSITIGTELGSYQITMLPGKSGMGEVYRARDAELLPSLQKHVPSPKKFSENPLCDVAEPSERRRHTCGPALEFSML